MTDMSPPNRPEGHDAAIERARARAVKSLELMQGVEPEGMVSRPHICAWSDQLSIANRDVIALADLLRDREVEPNA